MQTNTEVVRFKQKLEFFDQKRLSKQMVNRVIRYFPDTHLGNGHTGLAKIAQKNGINVRDLEWGEFVIFTNIKRTALKLFSQGHLVAHLKLPAGKLDIRTISLIPRYFNGGQINYDGAIEEVIRKEFGA